jgi:predicted acetyltransferase
MTFADAPIDSESVGRLKQQGLRLGLVDTSDEAAFNAWLQADARGFYLPQTARQHLDEARAGAAYRRTTGVWDPCEPDAATPVATVSSWPTPMAVPGERDITAWAISSVTVSPTHRRRGVARALLEAELRTAHELRVPLAVLTASEATIYSRYGFGPAARAADLSIDSRRARWAGPAASGRVHFISLEQLQETGRALFEASRPQRPGDVALDDQLWGQLVGVVRDTEDHAKHLRAVRYDDATGAPQGFAIYRVSGGEQDFSAHTVTVRYLLAVTDDAYAGLWRYLLDLDLVSTVVAPLRSVDEPLLWQVSNVRAVTVNAVTDHLWARILDVTAVLEARRYSAPRRIALDISDPLGFANEHVLLTIEANGAASVTQLTGAAPDDAAALTLTVSDLSALHLGGVSARTLVRAGRVTERRPGSAEAFDASFHSDDAPWLSTWF